MSDREDPKDLVHESPALDSLIDEARTHLNAPDLDWERIEARVMESVSGEEKKPAEVIPLPTKKTQEPAAASDRRERNARLLRVGAVALAAAAAVALFLRATDDGRVATKPPAAPIGERAVASSLLATEGTGQVKITNVVAAPGHVLRAGDTIDTTGARAVFDRPGKVAWLVEHDDARATAHVKVKQAGKAPGNASQDPDQPLVLALDDGAVEAQVTPVAAGEAFAVDIATERSLVRVAVHGTHLRVVRMGTKVTVDLTEGVVSIGTPPRAGMTYGTIANAPAHVEFDAANLDGTLRIDHTPANVRVAIPLGGKTAQNDLPAPANHDAPKAAPALVHDAPKTAPIAAPNIAPTAQRPAKPLPPRDAIAAAVRECAAAKSRPGAVRVTISSTLELSVAPDGGVTMATFKPPLAPDIQQCAAKAIYKQKLEETGLVTVPIEFSY